MGYKTDREELKILARSQTGRERERSEITTWHRTEKDKIEKQGLGTGKREPEKEKTTNGL